MLLIVTGLLLALPGTDALAAQTGGEGNAYANGLQNGNGRGHRPNILFVIMDDVGMDQMRFFGYGGRNPPDMPNIESIAKEGIRFRNTWAMPACSTTRAAVFTGRLPTRTNVNNALGQQDLANSMTSPFEMTTPKLLRQHGYKSALFGKFHIALPDNNIAGAGIVGALGWDYFAGWMDIPGDPFSIDQNAGIAPTPGYPLEGPWSCGFVPGAAEGGSDSGACYMPDETCTDMASSGPVPPGRTCRDQGGIFDGTQGCQVSVPPYVDFNRQSGHYVSPFVINKGEAVTTLPMTDLRSRLFRGQVVVNQAVEWIQSQPKHVPWMATVSFASTHTPVMQPPVSELHTVNGMESLLDCGSQIDQRELTNLMIEAMDFEVGRLLIETGLATEENGALEYTPEGSNTVLVILGDNGTLATAVKLPFEALRAKGTAYQTGVWVPLIVAGPNVAAPDREVRHMVNVVDLYQLFGELAGIDVHQAVPRPIDSQSMLPYLVSGDPQRSVRRYNQTLIAPNLQLAENGPCTINGTCTQLPPSKAVCNDNNGDWWGDDPDDPPNDSGMAFENCCQVNAYLNSKGEDPFTVFPSISAAVRDDRFKLVENTYIDAPADSSEPGVCETQRYLEFYEINESRVAPMLDYMGKDLDTEDLPTFQNQRFLDLRDQLVEFLTPINVCPGDGNIDFVVDSEDLYWGNFYKDNWGLSSDYDFNLDGYTNDDDIQIIEDNLGICPITVAGTGKPAQDAPMVQAAVNEGVARGKYGRVVLKGNFNFGDCASCIEIAGPVTIEGEGNPSGQALPDPSLVTTIDSGAIAPFVINDESEKGGTIRIERLWFRSSQLIAVNVSKLNSQLDFEQNRFTGITGQDTLRFAIGGAAIGPLAGNLKGSLRVVDNHIDTRAITFDLGDDNGIAFAMCEFERAEILDNRIYTRGEGVEFEGCHNSKSTIEIVGNDLITDATKSTLAPLSVALGIQGVGGHPAVLKVVGTEAKSVLIADNEVQLTGEPTAICIMPGLVNRKGSMSIQNNHCKMDGQFAAVLAGWAGAPIFFPPFYLQNSVVEDNVFEGSGQFGVAFADFDWIPNSGGDEVNKGNRNLFQNNSFDNFTADQAALYFGPTTFKNEYIGNPNGIVIDLGKRNQVVPD